MSNLDNDILLTKRELIEEITQRINDKLWTSDNSIVIEVAKTVGIEIVEHVENGLFFKKDKEPH